MTIRIAIVGAGISGLSAAWYLNKLLPEAAVRVYEASSKIGGVIQTHHGPYLTELGADNFATLIPDALQLVRDMGLEKEFITPNQDFRIAQVVKDGKLYPIPNGFSLMQPTRMGAILATPILSWGGKIRVLQEYFVKPRISDEDESVESFAIRRLGRECFERLVEPIVGGIFTARAETLSMQATMPQFVEMEKQYGSLIRAAFARRKSASADVRYAKVASGARYDQFLAPKQGMSWWFGQIAAAIGDSLMLNHRVQSIARTANGKWQLSIANQLNVETFDAVLVALPAKPAAALIAETHREISQELQAIPYASSAIAVLAVRRAEVRPNAFCFGSIAPTKENRNCLAVSLASEKYAGRCPSDTVIMRVFMGGAVRPEMLSHSDDHLMGLARQEVSDLFGIRSKPLWESMVRWNEAMPQYLVGHVQRVAAIRKRLRLDPSFDLIGNAYEGVGIPQCVRCARQAVERMAEHFKTAHSELRNNTK